MKAIVSILLGIVLLCPAAGCKKKPEVNSVDLDQINVDDSNNYRYIFKDTIREQEERDAKYKKREF